MKLNILEKKKNKWKMEVSGETHTLLNLLRANAWKAGAKQASYIIEHPYLSQPEIIIRADNPKRVLNSAAQMIIDDARDLKKEFKRAVKR